MSEQQNPAGEMRGANGEPIASGQLWAYRKSAGDRAVCVEVLRLGTSKPARVRVRFTADDAEGREDWVPPNRLKVRWEHVDGWRKAEEAWSALRAVSAHMRDTPECDAAEWIFETLADVTHAEPLWSADSGILLVKDVDHVVNDLDIDRATLTDDPVAITYDNGDLAVPWHVMEQLAKALAIKYADQLLVELAVVEREAERHNRWGYMSGSDFIRAEICAEVDQEHGRWRNQLRTWCGAEALDRHQELEALHNEVHRLGELVERAITTLEEAGATNAARRLEQDLGVQVEVLRRGAEARQREPGPYGLQPRR